MAKRKSKLTPNNDTKVAAVVIGLFAMAIAFFFFFSKGREPQKVHIPAVHEAVEVPAPVENTKSVHLPPAPTVTPEPFKGIPGSGGKIAFIIDDWGQTTANCKYLKEIHEPVAVSILPGLRHTKDVANCTQLYHKLAMLHLPLEAMHNGDYYPPDYIIKTTMDPALVSKIVDDDLTQLPSIQGVNNHMGSKATADRALMRIIFKRIKKKGLFFVDSMTSRYSVSAALAEEMGLSYGKRDVFLDNINTREEITKQMVVLAQKARHRGYAVAIGHDRHLTMQVLKEEIPLLEDQGFEIVSIKELLKNK
jgi:polysaccharide deacetylase 2 family uncharacterized protein YibQ